MAPVYGLHIVRGFPIWVATVDILSDMISADSMSYPRIDDV